MDRAQSSDLTHRKWKDGCTSSECMYVHDDMSCSFGMPLTTDSRQRQWGGGGVGRVGSAAVVVVAAAAGYLLP